MNVQTLRSFCSGKKVLFLDKEASLRRLNLEEDAVHRLAPFVLRQDRYLASFDAVLYTNPESAANRGIVGAALAVGAKAVYCLDGFYEYSNVCFNPRIRRERPFGTFVAAPYIAVRTLPEAVYVALLGKEPLRI